MHISCVCRYTRFFFLHSRIKDVLATDAYAYSFNPCYPFSEGTCNDVVVRSIGLDKHNFERKIVNIF